MNPKRLKPWQDAYNDKVEADALKTDYSAWLNGMYVLMAMAAAIDGKKSPYPEKAFSISRMEQEKAEAQEAVDEMAAARFMNWAIEFNKQFAAKESQDNAESTSQRS